MIEWDKPLKDGVSPLSFMASNYMAYSDAELAKVMTNFFGMPFTRAMVNSRRIRANLIKLAREPGTDALDAEDREADRDGAFEKEAGATSYLEAWQEYVGRNRPPDWRALIEHAKKGADLQGAYRQNRTRAARRIITDKPVFVVGMSDFHLGSPHTDYQAFTDTTDLIMNAASMYLLVVGPDQETAFAWFRSAEAVLNQVLPPWLQIELYRQWLDGMLPRTLAVCGDNHTDERLARNLGDIGLVWRQEIPYFRGYGILDLEVGPDPEHLQKYQIVTAHRYKGHSIYHDLQPALRMMRDIHPIADIYWTAHTHVPAHLEGVFYPEARGAGREYQHFAVCGTFKTGDDPFSIVHVGGRGVLGLPTFQLWPDQHRVQFYNSPALALEVAGR